MKYAIMADYYTKDGTEDLYLGLEGPRKLFVFECEVTERTKLFDTAREAGEYVDKNFSPNKIRCSFESVKIVEVKGE